VKKGVSKLLKAHSVYLFRHYEYLQAISEVIFYVP